MAPQHYFKITVADEKTGRGVPLVELRTVSGVRYLTDSSGVAAFFEPGLMEREVFFHVSSHGYAFPADGFGNRGARLRVRPGGSATLKIRRLNIAERLYRVTGEGIYRDSVLVGEKIPLREPLLNGQVVGQDTVYEAYTPLAVGSRYEGPERSRLDRDGAGGLRWSWKRKTTPLTPAAQRELVSAGKMKADESPFGLHDIDTGKPVEAHGGSVCWNEYRKRWILICVQAGGTSYLGEIWYAEAPAPEGPWHQAKKIVTHDRYSFYNPKQHPFFDQRNGRFIYFEGTYTNQFTGNPETPPTPRYEYNQILYRLDLADERLHRKSAP